MENTKIPIGTVDLRELDDIALAACVFHLSSALFPGIQGSSAIIRIIQPSHALVLLLKVLCCISHT